MISRPFFEHPAFEKLFVPILALVAIVLGASISYLATSDATERTLQAQTTREVAATRGAVYQDFLDAANEYYLASDEASGAVADLSKDELTAESAEIQSWLTARSAFQGQINRMYVHASDKAYAVAQQMTRALPPAKSGPSTADLAALQQFSGDDSEFGDLFNAMLKRLCIEVRAGEDQSCTP